MEAIAQQPPALIFIWVSCLESILTMCPAKNNASKAGHKQVVFLYARLVERVHGEIYSSKSSHGRYV